LRVSEVVGLKRSRSSASGAGVVDIDSQSNRGSSFPFSALGQILIEIAVHYSGSLHPNTSIRGISYQNPTTVYFQAANNSIMQLSVVGETSTTNIMGVMAVGEGAPGTRIGFISSTIDISFYLYFQNGSYLVQSLMETNNLTGEVIPGNTSFVSAVIFGDGVERSLIVSP
jgi:hypothetical protein